MGDGGAVVAEDLGDADLMQGDVGGPERGVPVVDVAAEPCCGGLGGGDELNDRRPWLIGVDISTSAAARAPAR